MARRGSTARRALLGRLPERASTWVQRARLTLIAIDELIRDHGAADAALAVVEIRDRAAEGGHRVVQARAEHALSVLLRMIGDRPAGLERAVAALALDGGDLDPVLRCRLRLAMADALAECGSFDDARGYCREAVERSAALTDPRISFAALDNWTYAELLAEDLAAEADLADRLQALAAESSTPLLLVYTATVTEVLHARGRSREAITMLREKLVGDHAHAPLDSASCWLALARTELADGDLDAAGASLGTSEHLATTHQLQALQVDALGVRATLLAARGDHVDAYATHRRFHAEVLELRSKAGEACAQTLHALLEVDVARRESARYREMSYRDSLTDLHNRRQVDEDLERRLGRGEPSAVAMVDLDHFKHVNDTCSHEAGDAVLVRLASLPADAAAASIGLATTTGAAPRRADRSGLLHDADRHLYAAKDHGRNRVEPALARSAPGSRPSRARTALG